MAAPALERGGPNTTRDDAYAMNTGAGKLGPSPGGC
jgi:hypothetical protein